MALDTKQLNNMRAAFATANGRYDKLDYFIMELQGTGDMIINEIVNDLIF